VRTAASAALLLFCAWAVASAVRAEAQTAAAALESQLPMGPSLFISPHGQPFRSGPGEPYPVARWFAAVDKNGDGKVDRAEFRADAQAFFETLDKNKDGVVDGFEVSDYEHDIVPEILGAYHSLDVGGDGERRHRPAGGERRRRGGRKGDADSLVGADVMGGASSYQLIAEPEPVAAADANLTGRISLADFLVAADRRFNRLDAKGQGFLILADLPKTPVQQLAISIARKK
jgi:hypothetical protein